MPVKIPDLPALGANVAAGDLFEIADISNSNISKKVTQLEILQGLTVTSTGTKTLTIASGKTFTASNTLTLTGTDGSSVAFGTGGTVLYNGGALGTPSSGTLTNATGLPTAGLVNSAVTLAKIQNAAANSKLLGSGAAGSGAAYSEITLGTGLAMSGTTLNSTGSFDQAGNYTLTGDWDFSAATVTFGTVSITTINATAITFEGSTPDANETTLGAVDPTSDQTINLPNASGVVALAELVIKTTAANYTVGTTDPRELYGGVIYVTSAATITIPAVAAGASFTVITIGAIAVSVDPNAADLIYLDGVALSDGDKITNTSTAGDIAVLTYYDATGWHASTNGWTDGN